MWPGGPDDDGHRGPASPTGCRAIAAARSASRPGSTVRRSRTTAPSSIRPTTAGLPGRRAASVPSRRARRAAPAPNDGSVSPGSEPPPTVDLGRSTSTAPAEPRRSDFGALARGRPAPARDHAARPGSPSRPGRPGTGRASRPARRASPCRAASPAPAGRAGSARRGRLGRRSSPACGPPTSLSPLNVTRSAPAARRSRRHRLVGEPERAVSQERAGAEVVDDDRAVAVGERRRAPAGSGASAKPVWRKFEGWTRRTTLARPSASGGSKSSARGPVRRPDLDQLRARPAGRSPGSGRRRRSRPARRGQRRHRRPARRGRRPERRAAALLFVTSASSAPVSATRCSSAARKRAPAPPGLAVELEEEIVPRGGLRGLESPRSRPRRAPEVRVDDDAGRVDRRGRDRPASPRALSRAGHLIGQRVRCAGFRAGQRVDRRSSATTARAMSTIASGRRPLAEPRPSSRPRRRSTLGGWGRVSVDIDPPGGSAWESNPPRRA